jgi:hypothetical protein
MQIRKLGKDGSFNIPKLGSGTEEKYPLSTGHTTLHSLSRVIVPIRVCEKRKELWVENEYLDKENGVIRSRNQCVRNGL